MPIVLKTEVKTAILSKLREMQRAFEPEGSSHGEESNRGNNAKIKGQNIVTDLNFENKGRQIVGTINDTLTV